MRRRAGRGARASHFLGFFHLKNVLQTFKLVSIGPQIGEKVPGGADSLTGQTTHSLGRSGHFDGHPGSRPIEKEIDQN